MSIKGEKIQEIGSDLIKAFETGNLPAALAQIFIHRKVEVPSKHWTWTNRTIGILRGHVYAAGFRQWEKLGRHVIKGQRCFYILAPKMAKAACKDSETGEERIQPFVVGYRSIPVFGYLQTQGKPLPGAEDESTFVEALPLVAVARSWGLSVGTYSIRDKPDALGFFAPGVGIAVGTENLSTWAHELIHAADHRLRTDTTTALEREVVAEFGSAILLECLGYHDESDRGGAYRYIEAQCKKEKRNVLSMCSELLDRTCRCVEFLLNEAERLAEVIPAAEVVA